MQEMIAYIAAVFVAVMIMFLLFTLRMRSDTTSVGVTQYYAAKDRSLDLATMLERDLRNMGAIMRSRNCTGGGGFHYHLNPDTAIVTFDTTGSPRVFTFRGQTDSCQAVPAIIQYTWTQNGTVDLEEGTKNLYDITRTVNGAVSTSYNGLATRLSFDLMRSDGSGILNLGDTRQVEVVLESVSPLGRGRVVDEVVWTSVIHPVGMSKNDWAY